MDKRVNRRDLIKSALGTSLLGGMPFIFPAKNLPSKLKITTSVKLIFDDGDYQEIFLHKRSDGKLDLLGNRLGHYSMSITTTYDINTNVWVGVCGYPVDDKPTIIYKGFDNLCRLVYTNTVRERIWKEYP